MAAKPTGNQRTVCVNRRARHDYEVQDRVEAGLSLLGAEVKALREGKASLVDAFVTVRGGQARLHAFEVGPYTHDHSGQADPRRTRRLLLNAYEIKRLDAKVREKGLTLIPLSVYFKGPWAKVEVALARGKRQYDKRQSIKRREAQRDIDRATRRR